MNFGEITQMKIWQIYDFYPICQSNENYTTNKQTKKTLFNQQKYKQHSTINSKVIQQKNKNQNPTLQSTYRQIIISISTGGYHFSENATQQNAFDQQSTLI